MEAKQYDISSMIMSIIGLISIIILVILAFTVPYKKGPQGFVGPVGFTGATGEGSSITGPTGPTGPTGVTISGFMGNTGPKGPTGAPAINPLSNYNIVTTSDININSINYKIGNSINIDNNSDSDIKVNLIGFVNTKNVFTLEKHKNCLCVVLIANEYYDKILVII